MGRFMGVWCLGAGVLLLVLVSLGGSSASPDPEPVAKPDPNPAPELKEAEAEKPRRRFFPEPEEEVEEQESAVHHRNARSPRRVFADWVSRNAGGARCNQGYCYSDQMCCTRYCVFNNCRVYGQPCPPYCIG